MLNSAYICETICRHSRYAHCLMEKGFVVEISSKWGCNAPPFPYPSMHSNISRRRKYKRIMYLFSKIVIYELIIQNSIYILFFINISKTNKQRKLNFYIYFGSDPVFIIPSKFRIDRPSGLFLWNFILIFIKREAY